MANKILLPHDFFEYNFTAMARKEANARNRVRLLAMASIQEGKPLTKIATVLKVHWKTIQTWLSRFRNVGISALYVKTSKDKPKKLNATVESWVKQFINTLNSNDQEGYITGKQLHTLVEKEFSIKCCLRSIYNMLHRLKFSWITSRSKHPKSDEELQALYKKLSKSSRAAVTSKY